MASRYDESQWRTRQPPGGRGEWQVGDPPPPPAEPAPQTPPVPQDYGHARAVYLERRRQYPDWTDDQIAQQMQAELDAAVGTLRAAVEAGAASDAEIERLARFQRVTKVTTAPIEGRGAIGDIPFFAAYDAYAELYNRSDRHPEQQDMGGVGFEMRAQAHRARVNAMSPTEYERYRRGGDGSVDDE